MNPREQHEMYLRGETDEYPYIDDEEKELIESIESNIDDYVSMPKDEMDQLIARMKKAIDNKENQEYRIRYADFKRLKEHLASQGIDKKVMMTLDEFMSDKLVINA